MNFQGNIVDLPKTQIRKVPKGNNNHWVYIHLKGQWGFYISFEELYYIVKFIGECEDAKYPSAHHEGRQMVLNFLKDTIMSDLSFEEIAKRYRIPTSADKKARLLQYKLL